LCNILLLRNLHGSLQIQQIRFLLQRGGRLKSIVIRWSGHGGTEAYLRGQVASFRALMLLVTIIPEMCRVGGIPHSLDWHVIASDEMKHSF